VPLALASASTTPAWLARDAPERSTAVLTKKNGSGESGRRSRRCGRCRNGPTVSACYQRKMTVTAEQAEKRGDLRVFRGGGGEVPQPPR
jgi:hypothetical protein